MKAIIIEEEVFDREFKATLEKLKLDFFEATPDHAIDRAVGAPLGDLHRRFHFEIASLQERLKRQ